MFDFVLFSIPKFSNKGLKNNEGDNCYESDELNILFLTPNLKPNRMNIEEIIKNNEGTILDVRTQGEFMGGNVAGSVNIPVQEIMDRLDEVKSLKQPLVLCCASGNRSGMAQQLLSNEGLECYNGGGWMDVNFYKS